MFKKTSFTLLLAVMAAHASASDNAAPADAITVRIEARQLEQQMYTVFNQLNSTDDFDVTCSEQKVTGSLISEWSCDAAFMRNASSRDASTRFDNPSGGGVISPYEYVPQSKRQISFKNRKKSEELNAEMMALARQNPELASAMIAYNNKRLQLEALEK